MGTYSGVIWIAILSLTSYSYAQQNSETDSSSYLPVSFIQQPPLSVPELIKSSAQKVPELALTLQLPKEEAPVPFYNVEEQPNTELKAPQAPIDYPVPPVELMAPKELIWNPDNNPDYYYESIQPQQIQYPKKYVKELYEKDKPSSINYKPLDLTKVEKILYNLSKSENRAQLQKEKKQEKDKKQVNKKSNESKHLTLKSKKLPTQVKEQDDSKLEATNYHQIHQNEPLSLGNNFNFSPSHQSESSKSGERLEFQMHGYKGPKSYKWGYDTGKGHNRHFRFEERDTDGLVKGQYGYYDKHGKLHVINYHAHPHDGFHAEESNHGQV